MEVLIHFGDINDFMDPGKAFYVIQCSFLDRSVNFNELASVIMLSFSGNRHGSNIALLLGKNIGDEGNGTFNIFGRYNKRM